MKSVVYIVFYLLVIISTASLAQGGIRQEQVQFQHGKTSAIIKSHFKADEIVDYRLRATTGQKMEVTMKASNRFAYFNVLLPNDQNAIFVGSTSGNHYTGILPKDGEYIIRVYLMRNAARRNEAANYTINLKLSADPPAAILGHPTNLATLNKPFDKILNLQGIKFHVRCQNAGSINTLQIVPQGLEIDNSAIIRSVEGSVTGAEVGDLNADGSPEVYVYVNSAGSGSYGFVVAYSVNKRKSLSEIYLPPLTDNKKAAQGYQGHDEFAIVENTLARRFPIYREADINAKPTGGMRQLTYKLKQGEAGWRLTLEKMVEY